MAYDNNMTGVLFKNDRKEKETHPDYKGSCEVEGKHYWLAGWIKKGSKGTYLSLALTAKEKDDRLEDRRPLKPDADGDIPW